MRRALRILRWLGVALVVALLVAAAVTQTAGFRSWLRGQVVTRLNAALLGRVAIGSLEGTLWGTLVLRDLRLTLDGERVLAARVASAEYDLLRLLLGGPLVLREVALGGVALRLVEDERGWNVARLTAPEEVVEEEEEGALTLTLEGFAITDASIKVVRPGATWDLRDLELAGAADLDAEGQRVAIGRLTFRVPERDFRLDELSGVIARGVAGGLTAEDVELRTGESALTLAATVPPAEEDGRYDVRLAIDRLSAAEVRRLLGTEAPASDLRGTLRARGPARAVAFDGTLTSDAGSLDLDGTLDLAGEPLGYDVRLALRGLDAAGLAGPRLPATSITGTVSATGRGTALADAATRFALALEDSRVGETTLARLDTTGEIAGGRLTVEAAAATEFGSARAAATLDVEAERYDVTLRATGFDPAAVTANPALAGDLNGTVVVAGQGYDPAAARATLRVDLARSRLRDVTIHELRARAQLAAGTLDLETLAIRSSALTADAAGSIGLAAGETPRGSLRYALRADDLAALGRLAGLAGLGGSATLTGTARGAPDALDVDATLGARGLRYDGTRVGTLDATVRARGLGPAAGTATLDARAAELHAAGRPLAALDLEVELVRRSAAQANAEVALRVAEDETHRHALVATAVLGETEQRLAIAELRLDLADASWRAVGTPRLVRRGERVEIEGLVLRSERGIVRAHGTGGTRGPLDLALEVSGLALADLELGLQPDIGGTLDATAAIGGTAARPTVDLDLAVAAPQVAAVRYETLTGRARIAAGRATVDARLVQAAGQELTLAGVVPLTLSLAPMTVEAAGPLEGTVAARAIDLAFVDPLLPQVQDLGGMLSADLALGGTVASPVVRGPVTLRDGRAYVVPLGVRYDAIAARLALDGPALEIAELRIASGDGRLVGGGQAELGAEGATIDARFELTRFPILDNAYGEGAVNGWIWMTGSTAAPVIEGALETAGLVLRIPEELGGSVRPPDPTITVIGPGAPVPPAEAPAATETPAVPKPGVWERAALTLQVTIPRDAWIRRSDANLELRGWLTAWKGAEDEPRLAGEIDAVRGWYTFQGKKFTVAEGKVVFTGHDFDPNLRIVATHRTGDYEVQVKVGGTLTRPALSLASDPSLEQADILSVLVFGKPARELGRGESKGLREQALGLAGSYVASELRQSVADSLGVDNLEFDTGAEGLGDASVSVGKYVAEDVFVSLAHRFGATVQELRIEYTMTPSWSLETSTDTLGDSGADVFWKRRY